MILEGPILLVILVVVALAIAALGVYVRFAMGKGPAEGDMILSRFLKIGQKADANEEAGPAKPAMPAAGGKSGMGLPPLPGGSVSGDTDKKGLLSGFGGGLSGLMSVRKNKEQIKEEVKAIDNQLAQVLQQSEAIGAPESAPLSAPLSMPDMPLSMPDMPAAPDMTLKMPDSMPLSMPESAPLSMPEMPPMPDMPGTPGVTSAPGGLEGMSLNLPDSTPPGMPEMQLTLPDLAPPEEAASAPAPAAGNAGPAPIKNSGEGVKKLCKEYVMPNEPVLTPEGGLQIGVLDPSPGPEGKGKSKKSKDSKGKYGDSHSTDGVGDFGGKKDASDDLLKDLEQEVTQEEDINMSIMKEYADMPITCDEIETDLKGILDNITVNARGNKNTRT